MLKKGGYVYRVQFSSDTANFKPFYLFFKFGRNTITNSQEADTMWEKGVR